MTTAQIEAFVAEMERRFRARTPTTDPNYANPDYRVGRSEMVTWAHDVLGIEFGLVESTQPELVSAIGRMWRRLKREYRDEWGGAK